MSELWADSLSLMLLGMGTVFVFLTLLVIAVQVMSVVVSRLPDTASTPVITASPPLNRHRDQELAAVAAVAKHLSRKTHND